MGNVKFEVTTLGGDKRTLSVDEDNILITNYELYNPTSTLLTSVDSISVEGKQITINAWDHKGKNDAIKSFVFEAYVNPLHLVSIEKEQRNIEQLNYAHEIGKTLSDMISCRFINKNNNDYEINRR